MFKTPFEDFIASLFKGIYQSKKKL